MSDPTKPLRPTAQRLLQAFRDSPSHQLTTHEMADVAGFGYNARKGEIRAWLAYRGLGRIECRPVPGRTGMYVFKLIGPIFSGVGSTRDVVAPRSRAVDSGGELGGSPPAQAVTEPDEPPASPDSARLFDPPDRSMHDREAA